MQPFGLELIIDSWGPVYGRRLFLQYPFLFLGARARFRGLFGAGIVIFISLGPGQVSECKR